MILQSEVILITHKRIYNPDKESYTTIMAPAGWIDTQKFDKGNKAIVSDQVILGNFDSVLLIIQRCSYE